MYTVLLSGGSGKRLWPLSNDLRSKQYIKLTQEENTNNSCSMVQRVWNQLHNHGLGDKCIITASAGQVEIIKSQLGNIDIAVEPDRRDTFPAIVISCAYLVSKMQASEEDYVCFLPVDPYTEGKYFKTLKKLPESLRNGDADIALMGAVPTEPSEKFGYIVPKKDENGEVRLIEKFVEKPETKEAERLIAQGALWNCGVFCFKIGKILKYVKEKYGISTEYESIYEQYDRLPKNSFDYEILEKESNLVVTLFEGYWKDLGTWQALTEEMKDSVIGNVIVDEVQNSHVINELDVPVVALGLKDTVIIASFDGILVSDKESSAKIKDVLKNYSLKPRYEERRWGVLKTLDVSQQGDSFSMFRKITLFKDMSSSYHYHDHREEAVTVISGKGEMVIDGMVLSLLPGVSVTIPRGKRHALKAFENLVYMETHIGEKIGDEDINRITFDWNKARNGMNF